MINMDDILTIFRRGSDEYWVPLQANHALGKWPAHGAGDEATAAGALACWRAGYEAGRAAQQPEPGRTQMRTRDQWIWWFDNRAREMRTFVESLVDAWERAVARSEKSEKALVDTERLLREAREMLGCVPSARSTPHSLEQLEADAVRLMNATQNKTTP